MHLLKFVVSFLAVGGATYAFIKINEMPTWIVVVTIAMAIEALIAALPQLPEAIGALENAGIGLACAERIERARSVCTAHTGGPCGNYAAGPCVVGIHCGVHTPHGSQRDSFAGYGATESDPFARALQHADVQGLPSQSCRRRVAESADEPAPRRHY